MGRWGALRPEVQAAVAIKRQQECAAEIHSFDRARQGDSNGPILMLIAAKLIKIEGADSKGYLC